jgi:hypothetical protein
VADLVQLLQTTYPMHWKDHIRTLGLSAGTDLPPAELAEITKHVFWMVRQTGMQDTASCLAFRAQLNAAQASRRGSVMSNDQTATTDRPAEAQMGRPKFDYSLTADGFQFGSHRHRCLYLGKSRKDRPQWLKENTGNYWRIQDLQIEAARSEGRTENQTAGRVPIRLAVEPGSHNIRSDPDDAGVAATPRLVANRAAPSRTLPTTPVPPGAGSEASQPEPQPCGEIIGKDIDGRRLEIDSAGTTACDLGHGDRPRRKQRKRQAPGRNGRSKATRVLSSERMLIVIETLMERPICRYAADKAGIHRKTLEYWLKRSKAGDDGYEVEWDGFTFPFHVHCETAIDIAHDKILVSAFELARGFRLRTDDNGNLVEERIGPPNGKMIRFLLPILRPETWGDPSKIDRPQTGGVLVLGEVSQQPEKRPTASIKARQWKYRRKTVTEAGA